MTSLSTLLGGSGALSVVGVSSSGPGCLVVAFGTLTMKEKSSLKPSLHFVHLKIFRGRKILIENYYYKQVVTLQELEWHGRKAKKALVPAFLINLYVVCRTPLRECNINHSLLSKLSVYSINFQDITCLKL